MLGWIFLKPHDICCGSSDLRLVGFWVTLLELPNPTELWAQFTEIHWVQKMRRALPVAIVPRNCITWTNMRPWNDKGNAGRISWVHVTECTDCVYWELHKPTVNFSSWFSSEDRLQVMREHIHTYQWTGAFHWKTTIHFTNKDYRISIGVISPWSPRTSDLNYVKKTANFSNDYTKAT